MRIAVVDGFGSGRWLARELSDRGAQCIHVKSRPTLDASLEATFRPEDYALDLGYDHDAGRLATRLANLGAGWILAGHQSGVRTADTLTELAGLPGNAPEPADARRDKQAMALRLYEAGLDAPEGTTVTSAEEAVAWFTAVSGDAGTGTGTVSVVVKPVDGGGADRVRFCTSAAQVHAAVTAILGSALMFGIAADQAALVQEALVGPEYAVDTVSVDGVHLIAETWCSTKRRTPLGAPLFDFEEPADVHSAEVEAVHGYVLRGLDALGVRHGAAHSEVVLTARGPVLIDLGTRLGGAVLPWVADKFLGYSHAGLLAESIVRPQDTLQRAGQLPEPWPEPFRHVWLLNHRAGTVRPSARWAAALEALPTAIAVTATAEAGTEVPVTQDMATSPGFVYLNASDPALIERDYRTIREWEQQGPYTA
ncbi:MAG: ATP-grasp domain-containing protein [Catenulisporales bacterium]|nr:ATP-grasp domain-containing protein [Catenulisporales bacterium]